MNFQKFYTKFVILLTVSIIFTVAAFAQNPTATPMVIINQDNREMPIPVGNNLYCASYVQTAPIDTKYEIVGAQEEKDRHIYAHGDLLYVNILAKSRTRTALHYY